MDQWYYSPNGQPLGPVPLAKLAQLVRDGKLDDRDMVWREGDPGWRSVANVPELAKVLDEGSSVDERDDRDRGRRERDERDERDDRGGRGSGDDRDADRAARPSGPGFLDRVQSMPKPILFGLYGAIGGLLGALILGEALWALLRPAPPPQKIEISVSPTVTLYPGSGNSIKVNVARYGGLKEGVRIDVLDAPPDVRVTPMTIPSDSKEGVITLTALESGLPLPRAIQVRVQAKCGTVSASEVVRLSIETPPPTLILALSEKVTVYPGDRNRFGVKIMRQRFEGAVDVRVVDPPDDVSVAPIRIAATANEGEMEVVAKHSAKPRSFQFSVEAKAADLNEPKTAESMHVHIVGLPPVLQLAVSPNITVYAGDKNKLTVKILRQFFDGPVRLEAADAPPDVKIGSVVIPEGVTDAEMEVSAGKIDVPSRLNVVRVLAKAETEKAEASAPFNLRIEQPPPSVQLAVSPSVPVYAGDKAKVPVKIARGRFSGPVTVQLERFGVPAYIAMEGQAFADGASEGEMEVSVHNSALSEGLPKTVELSLTARGERGATTTEKFKLEIVKPPHNLRMSVSPYVEVFAGSKCRFTVRVARMGFLGPVLLRAEDLPGGMKVPVTDIPAGVDEVELEGEAVKGIKTGKYMAKMEAESPPGPDGKPALVSTPFEVEVKPFDPARRPPPLDIVFVLDVTGSMGGEISGVRDGIGLFVKELEVKKLDFRIAMVAFRDITISEPPETLRFGADFFTRDSAAFSAAVGRLSATGGGDGPESSLDALVTASNLTYRANAARIFVLITDVEYQTISPSITMADTLKVMVAKKINQIYLVVPKSTLNEGPRGPTGAKRPGFSELWKVTKGAYFDINDLKKSKAAFAGFLPTLSKEIARVSIAAGPDAPTGKAPPPLPPAKDVPVLRKVETPPPPSAAKPLTPPKVDAPPPPKAEEVRATRVASVPPPPPSMTITAPPAAAVPSLKAVADTGEYAEGSDLQLLFAIALWTAVMAAGIGYLLVSGQKLYLQKSWSGLGDTGIAVGAGLGAGFLGGIAGQLFFQFTGGGDFLGLISRVAAWTLLGGILGAGTGVFVPNLKWHRGMLGGCIGGFIGAWGFVLFSLIGPLLGRWIGAALLGFFIGLMIALAELAFRRYWLEIAFGPREVRTVTLGYAAITIGSDERAAQVFVPGAAAEALRFRVEKDKVVCEDCATGQASAVAPGHTRQLGNVRIKVCSPTAEVDASGITLKLARGKTLGLTDGLPLTADELPGLDPQGSDGIVALVSPRPANPGVLLLRNRSKQTWRVTDVNGKERSVGPGLGFELTAVYTIDFGQVQGKIDPGTTVAAAPRGDNERSSDGQRRGDTERRGDGEKRGEGEKRGGGEPPPVPARRPAPPKRPGPRND